MSIEFTCASCGARHSVPDDKAGAKGRCACGEVIVVPAVATAPPSPPATQAPDAAPVEPEPQPAASHLPAEPQAAAEETAERPAAPPTRARWAVGLAAVVVLLVLLVGATRLGRHGPRHRPATPAARQAGTTSAGATSGVEATGADDATEGLTDRRLAEVTVEATLLDLRYSNSSSKERLRSWVAPRVAALPCAKALQWGICDAVINGWAQESGNRKVLEMVNKMVGGEVESTMKALTKDAPVHAPYGIGFVGVLDPTGKPVIDGETLYVAANNDETKWLARQDDHQVALVVSRAKVIAPHLAKPAFVAGWAKLLTAADRGLAADPAARDKMRRALTLPASLSRAEQQYCQRLTEAYGDGP